MKNTLVLFIFIFVSCKATKPRSGCAENEEFKKVFVFHVENIDKNIGISQDEKFRESVIFVSNYATVSTNRIMNYARTYPYGIYEKDRPRWIEWYEENRCKNIQFKVSYIIPDAYKE